MPLPTPPTPRLIYILDSITVPETGTVSVDIVVQSSDDPTRPGAKAWADHLRAPLSDALPWLAVPDAADRRIAQLILQPRTDEYLFTRSAAPIPIAENVVIRAAQFDPTLAAMCDTGRCYIRLSARSYSPNPVRWDSGEPWQPRAASSSARPMSTHTFSPARSCATSAR